MVMGLFGGKKEKVPDVPEVPGVPELPELPELPNSPDKKGPQGLPSFPTSSRNEELNQEMVKSAVNDSAVQESPDTGPTPLTSSVPLVSEGGARTPKEPQAVSDAGTSLGSSIPEPPVSAPPVSPVSEALPSTSHPVYEQNSVGASKGPEPIFVRIDKFQSAKDDLGKVQDKAKEMRETLRKINEVRRKEEEELKMWEEEVEKLKSLLGEIDSEVFSQI